jgi:hypothetical protein
MAVPRHERGVAEIDQPEWRWSMVTQSQEQEKLPGDRWNPRYLVNDGS